MIIKDKTILINDDYKDPRTNLLVFRFKPESHSSTESRLKNCAIQRETVDGKDIYIFDNLFLEKEGHTLRSFSESATFSKTIYASPESKGRGEKAAYAMNGMEKWQFFSKPLEPIKEVYNLFKVLGNQLDAEITTLPWELWDRTTNSPSFATNFIYEASKESMELGKHRDYHPEKGISFGIPVLYSDEDLFHEGTFRNGDVGKPWLVTVMLYATSEDFQKEHGLGTVFCRDSGEIVFRADCLHMRLIFFEGDLIHSIEPSKHASDENIWRVSYVFKLIINPKKHDQSMKESFSLYKAQHHAQVDDPDYKKA